MCIPRPSRPQKLLVVVIVINMFEIPRNTLKYISPQPHPLGPEGRGDKKKCIPRPSRPQKWLVVVIVINMFEIPRNTLKYISPQPHPLKPKDRGDNIFVLTNHAFHNARNIKKNQEWGDSFFSFCFEMVPLDRRVLARELTLSKLLTMFTYAWWEHTNGSTCVMYYSFRNTQMYQ